MSANPSRLYYQPALPSQNTEAAAGRLRRWQAGLHEVLKFLDDCAAGVVADSQSKKKAAELCSQLALAAPALESCLKMCPPRAGEDFPVQRIASTVRNTEPDIFRIVQSKL